MVFSKLSTGHDDADHLLSNDHKYIFFEETSMHLSNFLIEIVFFAVVKLYKCFLYVFDSIYLWLIE